MYCSSKIDGVIKSRGLRRAEHIARMEESRSAFKILTGKSIEKIPLGRPRHRWEDNIKMDLKEIGINMRNLIDLAHDGDYLRAIMNTEFNLRVR